MRCSFDCHSAWARVIAACPSKKVALRLTLHSSLLARVDQMLAVPFEPVGLLLAGTQRCIRSRHWAVTRLATARQSRIQGCTAFQRRACAIPAASWLVLLRRSPWAQVSIVSKLRSRLYPNCVRDSAFDLGRSNHRLRLRPRAQLHQKVIPWLRNPKSLAIEESRPFAGSSMDCIRPVSQNAGRQVILLLHETSPHRQETSSKLVHSCWRVNEHART